MIAARDTAAPPQSRLQSQTRETDRGVAFRCQPDAAVVDPLTLKNLEVIKGPAVLAIAARVGVTRLIDNVVIQG